MPSLPKAYDFLTSAFAQHHIQELDKKLESAGRLVSRSEGSALGDDADTFRHYYTTERTPGTSVSRAALLTFAKARFRNQMQALRDTLSEHGPGSGFALASDVADNWKSFISKENLFKYADLSDKGRIDAIDRSWEAAKIIGVPADAVQTSMSEDKTTLPTLLRNQIDQIEAKHWVDEDPAETPPTSGDLKQLQFRRATEVKVDDVVVGYSVWFHNHYPGVVMKPDGTMVRGLNVYEVSPDDTVAFADLTKAQKLDALRSEEFDWDDSHTWNSMSVADVLSTMGSTMSSADVQARVNDALDYVADQIDSDLYYMADVSLSSLGINLDRTLMSSFASYDDLVTHIVDTARAAHGDAEADEIADALSNGGADINQPDVSVFKEGDEIIGAKFRWSVAIDGDHDYWVEHVYDHTTNEFIGGATGGYETDTDTWVD